MCLQILTMPTIQVEFDYRYLDEMYDVSTDTNNAPLSRLSLTTDI